MSVETLPVFSNKDLARIFGVSDAEMNKQLEVGEDGYTRLERGIREQLEEEERLEQEELYQQAWADNRAWDAREAEMMEKAKPYLLDMAAEAHERELHDELMQHYYDAHLRRMKPSRARSFHSRV